MYTRKTRGMEISLSFAEQGPTFQDIMEKTFRSYLDRRAQYGANHPATIENKSSARQEMAVVQKNTS